MSEAPSIVDAPKPMQIEFGALAPKLSEQAWAGLLSDDEVKRFELIADSLTVVICHGIIPTSAGNKARDKLAKRILAALAKARGVQTTAQGVTTMTDDELLRRCGDIEAVAEMDPDEVCRCTYGEVAELIRALRERLTAAPAGEVDTHRCVHCKREWPAPRLEIHQVFGKNRCPHCGNACVQMDALKSAPAPLPAVTREQIETLKKPQTYGIGGLDDFDLRVRTRARFIADRIRARTSSEAAS